MIPLNPLRVQEHLHGHLGWMAAAALAHPAVVLRKGPRRAHWAVGLAVGLVTLSAALGVGMYPAYRETLRQPIFVSSLAVGYLFERKEHLAFGAVVLAWTGGLTYLAGWRAEGPLRETLRRVAHRSFVASAALAAVVAVLGTLVAAFKTF